MNKTHYAAMKKLKKIGLYMWAQMKDGLITNNPTFIQLLGMCPTLATTTSAINALGMGLAATAVLILSNVIISLLRKLIPDQIRIAAYIVIISGAVTVIELLMKAFLPALDTALGIFIPLIVVNCIILARAEAFASKNKVLPSLLDGLSMGLGFTGALFIIGTVREIIGAGTWLGMRIMPLAYKPATIFIMAPGAFLTLGMLVAAVNKIRSVSDDKRNKRNEPAFSLAQHKTESGVNPTVSEAEKPVRNDKQPDTEAEKINKTQSTPSWLEPEKHREKPELEFSLKEARQTYRKRKASDTPAGKTAKAPTENTADKGDENK